MKEFFKEKVSIGGAIVFAIIVLFIGMSLGAANGEGHTKKLLGNADYLITDGCSSEFDLARFVDCVNDNQLSSNEANSSIANHAEATIGNAINYLDGGDYESAKSELASYK